MRLLPRIVEFAGCGPADEGTNPGRTANKALEHLRAVLSWTWEQDLIESPPRFPKPREQHDVAGGGAAFDNFGRGAALVGEPRKATG